MENPIDVVKWVDRNTISPNEYNPNNVASTEMKLLEISIIENGWTQPIVIDSYNNIVDGYHRWLVSSKKAVIKSCGSKVPVVQLAQKGLNDRKMATIRHNRARGSHNVIDMSSIVTSMVEDGLKGKEIMHRLQMEKEEVVRLLASKGIPNSDVFDDVEFNKSWRPE